MLKLLNYKINTEEKLETSKMRQMVNTIKAN